MQLMNMIWCLRTLPFGCSITDHEDMERTRTEKEGSKRMSICNLYVIPNSSLQYRPGYIAFLGHQFIAVGQKKNRE